MKEQKITRNGQTVACFGEWEWDSSAECIFEDETLDGIYGDGGQDWSEVVEIGTEFARNRGTVLVEMTAC